MIFVKKKDLKGFPFPLIKDGKIDEKSLNELGKDMNWLLEELKKAKMKVSEVFIATEENDKLVIIPKQFSIDDKKHHKDQNNYSK